jgi:drug/metabolite transporter (DMT)-like permease
MSSSFPLILIALVCSVLGQVTLKLGMTQVGRIGPEVFAQPLQIVTRVLTTPMVVGGLSLYVLGAVAWLAVLSRVPLSLAHPTLALSFVLTPMLAWLVLGESVPGLRWLGIATICAGIVVVSRS